MTREVPYGSSFSPDNHPLASGGNRLNVPNEVFDRIYRKEIHARSAEFYAKFSGKIQSVREFMKFEYDNDGINNPPHVYRNFGEPNPKVDPSGQYLYMDDPDGIYLPHPSDAIIRNQVLDDEDTEISGTHWVEGQHYKTDAEGSTLIDAQGNPIPLGEFIIGPDGPETVVKFLFYERPDGRWFPNSEPVAALAFFPESVVFEEKILIPA